MSTGVFTSGSNAIERMLPCFPGYAMGGIIPTGDLELPYLEQQMSDIKKEVERHRESKQQEGIDQKQVNIINYRIKDLEKSREEVSAKIQKFAKEKEESPFYDVMLPIDYHRSALEIRKRADESENMHFVILRRDSTKNQIQEFSRHLTKMHYLPSVLDLIEQLSESIINEAKQKDQEVCLLGSFVTLSNVRVIDPIILRENAVLDEEITTEERANKYSVISESVLGGVFIGYGIRFSEKEDEPLEEEKRNVQAMASNLSVFSFVSQGAIPPTDNFNLWDTYNGWKKALTTDPSCGFPIAFKVRNLADVLRENNFF